MDPFSDLAKFAQTALSTVGDILNFNSTNQPAQPLQREESTRRNTPRPPQEDEHSEKSAGPAEPLSPESLSNTFRTKSSASTRSEIPPSSEGAKTRGGRSSGAGISGYKQNEYLKKLFPEPKKGEVKEVVNSGKSSKSTSKEVAGAGALTSLSGRAPSTNITTPRKNAPPAGRSESRGRTRSSASSGSKIVSPRSTSKVRASDAGPASDMTPRRQNAQGMVIRYHGMPIKPTHENTITQMEMGNQGIPNGLRRQKDEADQDKAIQDAHDKARQVNKRATDGALLTRIDSIDITYPDGQGPGGSRR